MISKIYLIFTICFSVIQAQTTTELDLIRQQREASCQASALSVRLQAFRDETVAEGNRLYAATVTPRLSALDERKRALDKEWQAWRGLYKSSLKEKYGSYREALKALTDKKAQSERFLNAVYCLYDLYSEWDEHEGDLGWIDACADREYAWSRIIGNEQENQNNVGKLTEDSPEVYRKRVLDNTLPKNIFAAYGDFDAGREAYYAKKKEIRSTIEATREEEKAAYAEYDAYCQARRGEEAAIIAEMVRFQCQSAAGLERLKAEFGFRGDD
jgi:hypothetical protein